MEPQRLIGRPVHTDDHRGRDVGCLEEPAPLRDQLTVTGEDDCLGRIRRDVHCDLPTTVVLERLGDELSRDRVGMHRFRRLLWDGLRRRLFGHLSSHPAVWTRIATHLACEPVTIDCFTNHFNYRHDTQFHCHIMAIYCCIIVS